MSPFLSHLAAFFPAFKKATMRTAVCTARCVWGSFLFSRDMLHSKTKRWNWDSSPLKAPAQPSKMMDAGSLASKLKTEMGLSHDLWNLHFQSSRKQYLNILESPLKEYETGLEHRWWKMNQGGGLKKRKDNCIRILRLHFSSHRWYHLGFQVPHLWVEDWEGRTCKIPSIFYSQSAVKLETLKGLIPGLRATEP